MGKPLEKANLSEEIASRRFASGTVVTMNLTDVSIGGKTGGCVYWADGYITGLKEICKGPPVL